MSHVPSDQEIDRDLAFAIQIAREAGERALGLRESGRWDVPEIVGDVGDQAADGLLQGYIRGRHPEDGLLSEETKDTAARLSCRRAWIVDPLDGTKEFRTGRDDWAVHVALTMDGEPVLGAVALPSLDATLWGVSIEKRERGGIETSNPKLKDARMLDGGSKAPDKLRVVCSRSHTPDWVKRFAESLDAELVPNGSVGFKASRLLLNHADIYVHKRGLKEWDTCAPECIARSMGWFVSRLDGSPQKYNQADPYNDELLMCRPAHAERVVEAVRNAGVDA